MLACGLQAHRTSIRRGPSALTLSDGLCAVVHLRVARHADRHWRGAPDAKGGAGIDLAPLSAFVQSSESGMRTISVLALRPVCLALTALELDAVEVLRRAGVSGELLADPDARIPAEQGLAVFAEATRVTGDPAFGLSAAAAVPAGALEIVDIAARSSPTVGSAIERFANYYALIDDGARIEVASHGDKTTIVHHAPRVVPPPPAAVEMLFGLLVLRTQYLAGKAIPLCVVRFIHDAPPDTAAHERFFRAPVTFGWPRHELTIDRSWLEAPIPSADPDVAGLAERFMRVVVGRLPSSEGLVGRVRSEVLASIASGPPRIEAVAARLGMSKRTLQRKLTELGCPFANIIDEVRREAALALLGRREHSIAEVGYVLGFSEPSAFHRAFRRWTGLAPSEYRRDPGTFGR
jgi:AraC-like DNA-binding protein